MNLMWRFLWTFLFARFATKVDFFSACKTTFRVWPTDIDPYMHMNNGRYFSTMDIARFDFLIRSGLFPTFKKNKIYPVIASEMIRFKKSLQFFQQFQISTQLIGWDEKFFYIVQVFQSKDEVYALALVKSCFIQIGKGPINATQVAAIMDPTQTSPPLPAWIQLWQSADHAFFAENMEMK